MLHLAALLFVMSGLGHGADPGRDVVIVFDISENSRPAVQPLQRGFARFHSVYGSGGATVSPLTFYLYKFENLGALESVVASNNPDLVLEGIASLSNTTITCSDRTCCSTGFRNYFPGIFDKHIGALIFLVVDCYDPLDNDVETRINRQMQRTGTTIVFVQITNSYAGGGDYNFRKLFLTELRFRLNTQNVGNAFYSSLAHYRSLYAGMKGNGYCPNSTFIAHVDADNIQAFVILVTEGQPRRPVEVFDPNGRSLANSTVTLFNDSTGATAIIAYAPCDPGWSFSSGKCYKRNSRRMSYERASAVCREEAATLLTEDDDIDLSFIGDISKWAVEEKGLLDSAFVWLDLVDWSPKRQFFWQLLNNKIALSLTGKTRWATGEPRRMTPGSRCVYLNTITSTWFVSYCQSLLPSYCIKSAYQIGGDEATKSEFLVTFLIQAIVSNFQVVADFLAQGRYTVVVDSYEPCTRMHYNLV